ncbi:methyl-accepting chemotaxis protein [Clostridium sp. HV4-5-A1G]|uniref:methyl-accepting chemotaxis protein n=1 Tax=Clostridium sp. HV4-5-A1G TaxID=2004595 RepID=UPI00123C20D5|nr:methyl-accepting chemotaxis protein [Clostridium sp. HV4-5-A1G]KAA8678127.1 methyl-accepting chemotaxis protein [Clostridium sp. HV4-5-A1G]CAB1241350.1 Methyl-accepting chemotaxis protein [Clostridiaceae bacterium BL-3]
MKRDARKDKENSKNNELSKSFFKSYLQFFLLIVFSVVLIGFIAFFSTKSALTTLGQTAIRNRVQMGLAMMDSLESQVKKGKITRTDAQEIFKSEMLNPKQSDGKTRGLNSKLELNIEAYMYAVNSRGIEQMHPYKEGEDISKVKDSDGNNLLQLIINEAKNPKDGGIVHFNWKNPGETRERPKVNAVAYFQPWDWYINVGCYDEDFYKPIYRVSIIIAGVSAAMILISILFIMRLMKKKVNPLSQIVNSMSMAAAGDMSVKVDVTSKDEIGYIGRVFNKMIDEIRSLLINIKKLSDTIDERIELINSSTTATFENSNGIKDAMEEISSAINNSAKDMQSSVENMNILSKNVDEVKENGINMKNGASEAGKLNSSIVDILTELEKKSSENITAAQETNNNLKQLIKKSNDILDIVSTIEEISDEINLLSLNASIESARAGEAGRGFAVVADQIKELSNQTSKSVKQINSLIKDLTHAENVSANNVEIYGEIVRSQIPTINKTKQILNGVVEFIKGIPQTIEKNVDKISEVHKNKDMINSSMDSILSVTEEISASSEEITASTSEVKEKMGDVKDLVRELGQSSKDLKEMIDKFSL